MASADSSSAAGNRDLQMAGFCAAYMGPRVAASVAFGMVPDDAFDSHVLEGVPHTPVVVMPPTRQFPVWPGQAPSTPVPWPPTNAQLGGLAAPLTASSLASSAASSLGMSPRPSMRQPALGGDVNSWQGSQAGEGEKREAADQIRGLAAWPLLI